MKKILIISIAAVLVLSLSACGAGDVGNLVSKATSSAATSSQAASSSLKVEAGDVEDSFTGLQKYVTANASVTGTPEKMQADLIGAASGVRYKYSYGGGKDNVTLELYEYDLAKLNSTAQKVISDVKSSGKFTLLDQSIDAVLSGNGKYLMIYKNSSTDSGNKSYGDTVKKLVTEFKK